MGTIRFSRASVFSFLAGPLADSPGIADGVLLESYDSSCGVILYFGFACRRSVDKPGGSPTLPFVVSGTSSEVPFRRLASDTDETRRSPCSPARLNLQAVVPSAEAEVTKCGVRLNSGAGLTALSAASSRTRRMNPSSNTFHGSLGRLVSEKSPYVCKVNSGCSFEEHVSGSAVCNIAFACRQRSTFLGPPMTYGTLCLSI